MTYKQIARSYRLKAAVYKIKAHEYEMRYRIVLEELNRFRRLVSNVSEVLK